MGGIRNKPNTDNLKKGKNTLEERWETPAPCALDIGCCSKGDPGSNDVADEPGGVVEGGESCAMLRMRQLGKKERGATLANLNTKTDQESSRCEHAEILRGSLKRDGNQTESVKHFK